MAQSTNRPDMGNQVYVFAPVAVRGSHGPVDITPPQLVSGVTLTGTGEQEPLFLMLVTRQVELLTQTEFALVCK